ncbi:hypothetical protein PRIC1_014959 [Phytophthora ramorum]
MTKRESSDGETQAPACKKKRYARWEGEEREIMLEACQNAGGIDANSIIAEYTQKMKALGKSPRGFEACLSRIQRWRSEFGGNIRVKTQWTSELRQLVRDLKVKGNSVKQISGVMSRKLGRTVSIRTVYYALHITGPGQMKSDVSETAETKATSDTDTEDEYEATSATEISTMTASAADASSSQTASEDPLRNATAINSATAQTPLDQQTTTDWKIADALQQLAGAYKILVDSSIVRLNESRSDLAIRFFVDGFKDTTCVADRVQFIRQLATDQTTATMFSGMDDESRRFLVNEFLAGN